MTVRKPMMAGNWKMHHTHLEAIQVVQKLGFRLENKDFDRVDVVVCPAFTALRSVQTTIDGDRLAIGLGAQNCHWESNGASIVAKLASKRGQNSRGISRSPIRRNSVGNSH